MHYVIGDIHGCFDELMRLLNKIEDKDSEARFFFLGDFIDRGPKVWETLEWMMDHITLGGKYQSVIGNHEYMVCQWYNRYYYPLYRKGELEYCPDTTYDFKEQLEAHTDFSVEAISKIVDFFETLPTEIDFQCEENGIDFKIVHGFIVDREEQEYSDEAYRESVVWKRNYWGNSGEEVIVHGHTPTFVEDYWLRSNGLDRKGMIGYRRNAINLDGGCVFHSNVMHPCFLCGICLETLEEFYDADFNEKLREKAIERIELWNQTDSIEKWIEEHADELDDARDAVYERKYHELIEERCKDIMQSCYEYVEDIMSDMPYGRQEILDLMK